MSSSTSTSTVNEKKKRELTEYNHFVRAKMVELKKSATKLEKGENFKLIGKAWQECRCRSKAKRCVGKKRDEIV